MLVIVLVTLLFATFALVAFIQKAHTDLVVESRDAISRNLRQDAYSALEVVIAVLAEFREAGDGLRSPAEGWSDALEFAGWSPGEGRTVTVEFDDESGKLSLPRADRATLVNLFKSWDRNEADAERLADALLDWMKKDHVVAASQPPDYDRGDLPYHAPKRPLRSYAELAAIDYVRDFFFTPDGEPTEFYPRFVEAVSLYDFAESNLNSGRADVIAAMGSHGEEDTRALRDFLSGSGNYARQGPGFLKSADEASALLGPGKIPEGLGTLIRALRVRITVAQGRTQFHLDAVIAPPDGARAIEEKSVIASDTGTQAPAGESRKDDAEPDESSDRPSDAAAKKLNYPFTLLEIRENTEISTLPDAPPPA